VSPRAVQQGVLAPRVRVHEGVVAAGHGERAEVRGAKWLAEGFDGRRISADGETQVSPARGGFRFPYGISVCRVSDVGSSLGFCKTREIASRRAAILPLARARTRRLFRPHRHPTRPWPTPPFRSSSVTP
jgi:hypothetical protein